MPARRLPRTEQPAGPPRPTAGAVSQGEAPVAFVARKGRGAVSNIAHRFESVDRTLDGDALDAARLAAAADGDDALPLLPTEVMQERVKSLLAYNDSPDIPFDRSINPYRGCEHGCIYCYARPTHSYLNLSPGLDFETKLVAKINAVQQLQSELAAPSYRPAVINVGSATDAYQPIERDLRLTRGIVEVLVKARHPFSIVTKSSLVERDLDLLRTACADQTAAVFISLTTLDPALSRLLEPRAASPARRLRTIETLAAAGVPVHVNVAPVIPFITEPELERILKAARDAGAGCAHYTVLRLPWEVSPLFQEWLAAHFPERAQRVMNRVREMRGGREYDASFASRMKGEGTWAALVRQRFDKAAARLGFVQAARPLRTDLFEPPRPDSPQLGLF
ncbi:MAG: PA0069 family radical SAM protein [Burkholderiaceae bacterium]|jgi:DNA repair photolyase|nr:PA0069 family radical SAM protein [Burkholderiaceae bacterium]